jgi:SAM-dependent methyltransferase
LTRWQDAWVDRFYRARPGWRDGTAEFHELCESRARGSRVEILEVGAGPTNATSAFLSKLGAVHGVDVSDEVHGNAHLTSSALIEDGHFPFPDKRFDLVVSNYVVEHVADPGAHLSEIHRVLKDGGSYVFRTPNMFHYVSLVSYATPHTFHRLVANRLRALPTTEHDPWPTVYAMNTPRVVRRLARAAGFAVDSLALVEKEPVYGKYSRALFVLFTAYERAVNASDWLGPFRANMFVVLRKL